MLPEFTFHDLLDDIGIAAILDEELPDTALPSADISNKFLKTLNSMGSERRVALIQAS